MVWEPLFITFRFCGKGSNLSWHTKGAKLLLDILEPDGTTFGRSNEPLDLLQARAAGSTEEFSATSCEELRRTVNTYMKRVVENFPAFAHTMVTGTDIYFMERLSLEGNWRLGFHGYKVYRGSYQNRK